MAIKTSLGRLNVNKQYAVQIKARRNSDGKESDWSPVYTFKTISDGDAPEIPSLPDVTDYIGTLIIRWDGKDKDGNAMDADFARINVHVSTDPNFIPTAASLYQTLEGFESRETAIPGLPFVDHYVKFTALDIGGNESLPTAAVKGQPRKVYGDDVAPQTITQDSINFDARDIGAPYVFFQTSQPTSGMKTGDTWYDTDDNNKLYTYSGTEWFAPTATANGGQAGATGVQVYRQNTAPSGGTYNTNDVWFDTGNGNAINLWTGTAWTRQPFGTNAIEQQSITNALIANLDAGKITSGFVSSDRIQANSLDASKITAGTITTDRIGANQVTAAKIAANTITAGSAIIADAAIQAAKIGSVSAGTITSGFLAATLTVSGTIRTSTGNARTQMDANGLSIYDSTGLATNRPFYTNTSGQLFVKGEIKATTFYSAGIDTNGTNYIEIGDSLSNEINNDEIRFKNGTTGVSIRNPNSNPGRFRISVRSGPSSEATFDFDVLRGVISPTFTVGSAISIYPSISTDGTYLRVYGNNPNNTNAPLYLGSVEGFGHGWVASGRTGLQLSNSEGRLAVRNSSNSAYANFIADYIYGTTEVRSPRVYWNVDGGNTSISEAKDTMTPLNLDMFPLLESAEPHVWQWKQELVDGEGNRTWGKTTAETSVGLLLAQLPPWMSLGSPDIINTGAMHAGLWQACRQLMFKVRELESEVQLLKNGNN